MAEDKYASFEQLRATESARAWQVVHEDRGTAAVIVAPHAGGIERGTSEVARAIAGEELSFYLFEGLKPGDNTDLHITSENFDEPTGLQLVELSTLVVSIHGAKGKTPVVFVGGLDMELGAVIRQRLHAVGFAVQEHPRLQGVARANICNRGKSGKGVQLELAMALRETFFEDMTKDGRKKQTARFAAFVNAVRAALGLASA
jgi:phage replication-related protein YjqB (UPF0714/DUF867 family)